MDEESRSDPPVAPIPRQELRRLAETCDRAYTFAAEGRLLSGCLAIYSGLTVARERGEDWAPAAVVLWEQALNEYKTRYPRNWAEFD